MMNTLSSLSSSFRRPRIKAAWDLLLLVVLIAIGGFFGFAFSYAMVHSPSARWMHTIPTSPEMEVFMERLCAYVGAGTFVGLGLCNRMARKAMFRVSIGSFPRLVIVAIVSYFIGIVCLPGVIVWRVWAFVALLWRSYAG